jgi:hypothetical protein
VAVSFIGGGNLRTRKKPILLDFALMAGYLFVFHFITFCSDGGVFICFSFYYILLCWWGIYLFFILLNEKQINTPPSEQNVIK